MIRLIENRELEISNDLIVYYIVYYIEDTNRCMRSSWGTSIKESIEMYKKAGVVLGTSMNSNNNNSNNPKISVISSHDSLQDFQDYYVEYFI